MTHGPQDPLWLLTTHPEGTVSEAVPSDIFARDAVTYARMNPTRTPPAPARGRRRRLAAWSAAAAAGLAVAWWALRGAQAPEGPVEGAAAPELRLADLSGQAASLSQYRGKVVLVDFWATWCEACREELPDLKRLHGNLHPKGFELLGASLDEDGRKALLPFVAENSIPWRVLLGDENAVRAYNVYGLPAKFLIDRDGIVARKYVGWVEPAELERDIEALLNKETHPS